MPSNGFRRSKRLIAATVAIAATGGTAALAFTGQPGSNGTPTSAAPDIVSATIISKVDPGDPLGPQVRACFDEAINQASILGTEFRISTYDSNERMASSGATIDTQDTKCIIVTFANGEDIGQGTVFYYNDNAFKNVAGNNTPAESAPLEGTDVTSVAGATTAPDLVSTSVSAGESPPRIAYTFDENLDPALSGGGANLANKFGFYVDTDDGATPRRGATIIGVSKKTIVVSFTIAQSVQQAKLFFVDPLGAGMSPQDRVVQVPGPPVQANQISPIGSTGAPITGGPTMISAAKQAGTNGQIVDMTFAQAVIPGTVGAAAPGGNVVAYRADANTIAGTYVIGTSGANTSVLPVTLPPTTQRDNGSVVRLGIRPGLVRNQANDRSNAISAAAIGTEPSIKGLTDGPDLLSATVDDANNRVNYVFDEALHQAPDPDPTQFQVINADGTKSAGQAGSAVVSSDRKSVSVKFGGSVSGASIAGVSNDFGAAQDAVDDNPAAGNNSVPQSVSLQAIACQPGTCPVTPTPTATTTTVPPTPTPTATQKIVNVKTKVTATKKGKTVKGKVKAAAPCKAGRTVTVKGKSTKSKANGSYSVKFKKKVKGKPKASVKARSIKQGTTTFKCSSATSK